MGKIHTHYDNLKVARLAPQEVIRAAYKALSQKYHPDKNPGDEKAARIMAIVNSAYGTLSDPQRRKEHDEWIAAEEWEIAWLESTHQEENRNKRQDSAEPGWARDVAQPPRRARSAWRSVLWGVSLLLCLLLGWLGAMLMLDRSPLSGTALASALGSLAHAGAPPADMLSVPAAVKSEPKADTSIDSWAVGKPYAPEPALARPPEVKVMAVAQLILQSGPADINCERDRESQALVAPNGEAWPEQSGYVPGFPIGNKGDALEVTLDNSGNPWPAFIKLYDIERRANVRYLFILPNDKLTVDKLAFGKYEVRYQKIAGGADDCRAALRP
ncbi:J domain-containing protein [Janthinobacterium agaricidamnosum]|uniref:DnaJ domain protein n=1 Tax=Janthinobacterium agaricidamnosum NBRC 102515 = DSM 9628 TaxID=1349767 RepID=W0VD76_9BURK|nr:J domain-containing protein [Janthinobacterium agaricidamnosum]CDG85610.1 dnaJ domain protein [Janthinobacterium agaricidamnosum NBRC 102515 = DSM 9628]